MQQKSAWDDLRGTSPATRHSYVHIAHTRYTHTCVITVSPHMWIQIYCTVLYCLPYCLVHASATMSTRFSTNPHPQVSQHTLAGCLPDSVQNHTLGKTEANILSQDVYHIQYKTTTYHMQCIGNQQEPERKNPKSMMEFIIMPSACFRLIPVL